MMMIAVYLLTLAQVSTPVQAQVLDNPLERGVQAFADSEGGSVRGGGGDHPVDMQIKRIREQLAQWLESPSARKLDFKGRMIFEEYVQGRPKKFHGMKLVLSQGAVHVRVIHASEQDPKDELQNTIVDGDRKVCKGIWEAKKDKLTYLICEIEAFSALGKTAEAGAKERFALIHHEYAGLAGIERNKDESDYFISEQVRGLVSFSFEQGEVVFSLPIDPNRTFTHVLHYLPIKAKGVKYTMGSPLTEIGRYENEPQREVTLPEDFQMLETPITQYMFRMVMEYNPSFFKDYEHCPLNWDPERGGECTNNPVESVRLDEVKIFLKRMNEIGDGWHYRLPTEEEWEYAARGGTTTARHFEDKEASVNLTLYAWIDAAENLFKAATQATVEWATNSDHGMTHEVGYKWRNQFGLKDMLGNVTQWTSSLDRERPVIRGSGFHMEVRDARSARRYLAKDMMFKSKVLGIRLVRTAK